MSSAPTTRRSFVALPGGFVQGFDHMQRRQLGCGCGVGEGVGAASTKLGALLWNNCKDTTCEASAIGPISHKLQRTMFSSTSTAATESPEVDLGRGCADAELMRDAAPPWLLHHGVVAPPLPLGNSPERVKAADVWLAARKVDGHGTVSTPHESCRDGRAAVVEVSPTTASSATSPTDHFLLNNAFGFGSPANGLSPALGATRSMGHLCSADVDQWQVNSSWSSADAQSDWGISASSPCSPLADATLYLEPAGDLFVDGEGDIDDINCESGVNRKGLNMPAGCTGIDQAGEACADFRGVMVHTEARKEIHSSAHDHSMLMHAERTFHQASCIGARSGITSEGVTKQHMVPAPMSHDMRDQYDMCFGAVQGRDAASAPRFNNETMSLTTLMVQCIPLHLDEDDVRAILDERGFSTRYDAVYVPRNNRKNINLGYAFVNFHCADSAAACISACSGLPFGDSEEQRPCSMAYAKAQGFASMSARAGAAAAKKQRRDRRRAAAAAASARAARAAHATSATTA